MIFGTVWVDRSGHVTKMERIRASVKNMFNTVAFPFDEHHLELRIASQTYMATDLVLVPSANSSLTGIASEGIFDESGWTWSGHHLSSFEEIDGPLEKSRGQLEVTVAREPACWSRCLLFPELLMLGLALTAFIYPLVPQLLVARVVTCLVSCMALLFLWISVAHFVPVRGWSWFQLHGEFCLLVGFTSLVLNMMVEVVAMYKQLNELAHVMHLETQFIIMAFVVVGYVCIMVVKGSSHSRSLSTVEEVLVTCYVTALILYTAACHQRIVARFAACEHPEDPEGLESDDDEEFVGGGYRRRGGFFAQFQARREGRRQPKERPWGQRKPKAGDTPQLSGSEEPGPEVATTSSNTPGATGVSEAAPLHI